MRQSRLANLFDHAPTHHGSPKLRSGEPGIRARNGETRKKEIRKEKERGREGERDPKVSEIK